MMLKAEDLNVYYGPIHAVKGVSFEVKEGEIVTLIGANGAGKSTTLKTVSGLMRSRGGRIEFMDKSIASAPAHKIVELGLAHVPEGRRIFTRMTVEENLDMGAFIKKNANVEQDKGAAATSTPIRSACLNSSPASRSAANRSRAPSPAASSRCWPWAAR